ncbi:hypothetical protein Tco_0371864 [Tanacetum coccineum]
MDGTEFNRDLIPFARIITTLVEFIKNEHPEDDFRVMEVDDSPPEHPKDKSGLDASAKLTRAKLNKRSGDADLSKDKSGLESPPKFWRSWYIEGHLGDEGLSSGGNNLNSIFITAEVTFTNPKQPINALDPWIPALEQGEQRSRESMYNGIHSSLLPRYQPYDKRPRSRHFNLTKGGEGKQSIKAY